MTRLSAIAARAERATRGPWESAWDLPHGAKNDAGPDGEQWLIRSSAVDVVFTAYHDGYNIACKEPDAAFIAASREDVPWLLGEVKRLQEALRDVAAGPLQSYQRLIVLKALEDA